MISVVWPSPRKGNAGQQRPDETCPMGRRVANGVKKCGGFVRLNF